MEGRFSNEEIWYQNGTSSKTTQFPFRTFHLVFPQGEAEGQQDDADAEEEDDTEDPDVLYEADVMQDQRVLDNDDVRVFGTKSVVVKGGRLRIVDPFAFRRGVDADGFQVQNPRRLMKKLKRTIIQELSRKDVMPDNRVRTVSFSSFLIIRVLVKYWRH